jgi:hypothetical protein
MTRVFRWFSFVFTVGCASASTARPTVIAPVAREEPEVEEEAVACDSAEYAYYATTAEATFLGLWGDPEEGWDGFHVRSGADLATFDVDLAQALGMLTEAVLIRRACGVATDADVGRVDAELLALHQLVELDLPPGSARESHYEREFSRLVEATRTLVSEALAARDDVARAAPGNPCETLSEVRRLEWEARAEGAQREREVELRTMLDENRYDGDREAELIAWEGALREVASLVGYDPPGALELLRRAPELRGYARHLADIEELVRVCEEHPRE